MAETFYDVLSVPPDADESAVEAAYREAVKEAHPDVSDDPDAEERFKRLTRAKEVLTDEDKRAAYDHLGHEQYLERVVEGPLDPADVSTGADARAETSTPNAGPSGRTGDADASRTGGTATGTRETTAESARGTDTGATRTERGPETTRTGRDADGRWRDQSRRRRRAADDGYATRRAAEPDAGDGTAMPLSRQSLPLAGGMFVAYPLLVAASVTPLFPTWVNLTVGLCTLVLVAYLLSIPDVAVVVFGAWSLLAPLALLALGTLFSLVGAVSLVAVWFPFGLAALARAALRS